MNKCSRFFSILSIQKLGFTFKIYMLSVTSTKTQFLIYTKKFLVLHKICFFLNFILALLV